MAQPEILKPKPAASDLQTQPDFSLVLGGPLYQLYLRTRLARPPLELLVRRMLAIPLICWLPLLVLAGLAGLPGKTNHASRSSSLGPRACAILCPERPASYLQLL